jgi:TolB-like protein
MDVRGFVRPSQTGARAMVTLTDIADAPDPVLAVLPFDNQSVDPDLQFFSDGIAEEIVSSLSSVGHLRVIGTASSFSFRGDQKKNAARALGATHVLSGSVRRSGARARITAQLTDAGNGHVLWSERYERDLTDVFAVQDEISQIVASSLATRLTKTSQRVRLDPQAYDLYLRALKERRTPDPAFQRKSLAYLEAAVRIEPEFLRARAALALARCHAVSDAMAEDSLERIDLLIEQAREEARNVLRLSPADGEARLVISLLSPGTPDWALQEAVLHDARRAAPNDLLILAEHGRWLLRVGRLKEAFALMSRGYEADPLSPYWMSFRAVERLVIQGDLVEAEAFSRRAMEHATASSPRWIFGVHIRVLLAAGKLDQVRALLDDPSHPLSNAFPPVYQSVWRLRLNAAEGGSEAGLRRERQAVGDGLIELGRARPFETAPVVPQLVLIGHVDTAYAFIEEQVRRFSSDTIWHPFNRRSTFGGGTNTLFTDAKVMEGLFTAMRKFRLDARFLPLCHSVGLCSYWSQSGKWPDFIEDDPEQALLKRRVEALASS